MKVISPNIFHQISKPMHCIRLLFGTFSIDVDKAQKALASINVYNCKL